MRTLNRAACEALRALPPAAVHACTDITGFGLVGHASEMALASGTIIEIDTAALPVLPGALALAEANVPGGGRTNAEHFAATLSVAPAIDARLVLLAHDPQTSGGLLASVAGDFADAAANAFAAAGVAAWRVGRVLDKRDGVAVSLR
jgi:selenide,water dikinase